MELPQSCLWCVEREGNVGGDRVTWVASSRILLETSVLTLRWNIGGRGV